MNIDWSKAPEGTTHYIPETARHFACWAKSGFTMREGTQTEWVEFGGADEEIFRKRALPRPEDIDVMVKTISALVGSSVYEGDVRLVCAAVRDAGYRKFEIVEEDV